VNHAALPTSIIELIELYKQSFRSEMVFSIGSTSCQEKSAKDFCFFHDPSSRPKGSTWCRIAPHSKMPSRWLRNRLEDDSLTEATEA